MMVNKTRLNSTHGLDAFGISQFQEAIGVFFMVMLSVIALVANTAVMVVILKTPLLRKFIFVCHLCLVDLLSAIFIMPLGIISSSTCFNRILYSIAECQTLIFLNVCFISASILTISVISIERYYYIVHPMRYEVKMTTGLAVTVVVFIWIKSMLVAALALVGWPQDNGASSASKCTVNWSPGAHKKIFVIIFSLLCFILPSLIIFAVYGSIYKVARIASLQHIPVPSWTAAPRQRSESIHSQVTIITTRNVPPRLSPERFFGGNKAALTLVLIVGQFLCCWLPFFSFHLHCSFHSAPLVPDSIEIVVTWLAYSSFAINPFFYGLLNRQIREELAKMRRHCLSKSLNQDFCISSPEGSIHENFLQFLQRTSCTFDNHSSYANSSPRNTLEQTASGFRIPGQIPEETN
ncbi:PREDICTED: probable G-protein coupled receptor [Thamnophis sirtalis]|uniref:Probable G-protein coupled receptor n=1 Tax=Thamnophis sirtalis TaxID=35019 RepID=A0A6I9YUT6_9SAUR|nr:PREDICTED: probable G-protein coupled receptor [Thamnophis sirtalis]XP_013928360.1 PREDICTED: probable G-protein coupled receptor [Thamnophis sirtalis]XP_013928361.1 PREDICTED: probable G-protein coupled receptor [Thamnophis sirtalis]XP_013928362.1 PREDICTED: probable G-protein coupled receptor [Thamnophis sirtalis]